DGESRAGLERQLPDPGDEIVAAETRVRFFAGAHEAGFLVQMPRRKQLALRPEHDLLVPGLAGETDALSDEPLADAVSARGRFDVEQPQFGDRLRLVHEKDRACDRTVLFGNPATIAFRIEVLHELTDDRRDECLEPRVVAILPRVQRAVTIDDPAEIARLRIA